MRSRDLAPTLFPYLLPTHPTCRLVCRSVEWEDGDKPPPARATDVLEGQAGDLPKSGCSMSWTAAQVLAFMPKCVEVFAGLVAGGLRRQQEATHASRAADRLSERRADFGRAWESLQALCAETEALFAFVFTTSSIADLDRLIWDHDVKFLQVSAYSKAGLWTYKNSVAQLAPLETLLAGPMRWVMNMRFEGMNKISKSFAKGGSRLIVLERTAKMWALTSAFSMRTGKTGAWGRTHATHFSEPQQVSAAGDALLSHLFALPGHRAGDRTYVEVHRLCHLGQTYAGNSWVLAETMENWLLGGASARAFLGYIERIVQVGETFYMSIVYYPELDVCEYSSGPTEFVLPLSVFADASPPRKRVGQRVDNLALTLLACKQVASGGEYRFRVRR